MQARDGGLARRIIGMEDEELLEILTQRDDYIAEVQRLAEQEVDRRGGQDALRARLAAQHEECASGGQENHTMRRSTWRLSSLVRWLVPVGGSFERYPDLRVAVSVMRVLTMLIGLLALLFILGALVVVLLSDRGIDFAVVTVLIAVAYSVIGVVGFLSMQGVIVILMDVECSVRRTDATVERILDALRVG